MQNLKQTVILSVFLTLIGTILVESTYAIPAFARKYSMSCTTCHAPYPRLKPYGDEFAANGFTLKDKDAPRYFVDAGDQELSLLRELPLAVRLEGYTQFASKPGDRFDFTSPYNLKLLSGGALANDISYYFYFFLSERGEVAGIEDAFILFNDLGSSALDLYVGQFQVSDPLFKREVRLPYEDYQIYRTKPGLSTIGLTYDRGIMLTYGFESGTDVVLEILNGNGIGSADDNRLYDNDKYKTIFGRLSQDVGNNLRIGGFGCYGKEGPNSDSTNEIWMAGPDASITTDKLALNLQYVERRDDNPSLDPTRPPEVATRGGFAELVWLPNGDRTTWYAVALYNNVDSDQPDLRYESLTAHVGYLMRTNIRLTAELIYDIEQEESRFLLGLVSAF
jgi:hypothetical protein